MTSRVIEATDTAGQQVITHCDEEHCTAAHRITDTDSFSLAEIRSRLVALGWSPVPSRCPNHNPAFLRDVGIAREAIAGAIEESLRLLMLTGNITLAQFNEQFPGIHDELSGKAASAAVRALHVNSLNTPKKGTTHHD